MAYRSILQMEVSDHIKSFPSLLLFKEVPTSGSTNNSHKNIIKILYDFDQKHIRLVHGVPYLYKKLIFIFPMIKEYHSFTYNKLSWVSYINILRNKFISFQTLYLLSLIKKKRSSKYDILRLKILFVR